MKIKTLDLFKVDEGVHIRYFSGLFYRIVSKIERKYIKNLAVNFSLNKESRNEKIILSLTSFPGRIETAGYAIKSLFNQTIKADKIILWLSEKQFNGIKMPALIEELCKCGLEIRFCDADLRAHKKYFYALQEQKQDELVITYDDDLIYPENSVELLYKKHKQFPNCVICNRAQLCSFDEKGLTKYNTWKLKTREGHDVPSRRLFPSTGAGTLYPYKSINNEAFCVEKITSIAMSADDLWMRFMSAKNKTRIIKTRIVNKPLTTVEGSQTESLQVLNCIEGENDRTLKRLSDAYPEVLEEIKGE